MSQKTRDASEFEHVAEMIKLLPLDVKGAPEKRERPDFFVQLADGRKIGLEVTRALDPFRAAGRGARDRIKAGVLAGLKAKGLTAWVNISASEGVFGILNREPKVLKADVEGVIGLAAACAHELKDEWICWEWSEDDDDDGVPPDWREPRESDPNNRDLKGTGITYLERVMIYRGDEPRVTWSSNHIGGGGDNLIQSAINKKVAKLDQYKLTDADEHWLLIVGSTGTGGSIEVSEAREREFVSPFARTIFLELFSNRCIELKTRPTSSGP